MRSKVRVGSFLLVIVSVMMLALASRTLASEWKIVGPRALGMGGANVAVANDVTASYWNPAAFGFFNGSEEDEYGKRGWSTTLAGVGVGAKLHGNFGDTIDKVTEIDFDGLTGTITADKVSDFIELLSAIEEFRGNKKLAVVTAYGGVGVQSGHFGFGSNVFLDVTANPNFDFNNIGPDNNNPGVFTISEFSDPANLGCGTCSTASISVSTLTSTQVKEIDTQLQALGWTATQRNGYINAVDNGLSGAAVPSDIVDQTVNAASLANNASGTGPISKNTSTLRFKGIGLIEIPLTYGHAFSENLSIGGNLKYMKARVYNISIDILNQDFGDALDDALDDYEDESNFGIDLGALYRVGDSLRVGIVGRNLNSPTFGSVEEEAQLRTGVAYQPSGFITLAADLDLTENDVSVGSNVKSQNFGAGVELNLFKFLQLRGGFYKNISEGDIGVVYTAGVGVNLWVVNLDVGVSRSGESSELDGDSIPKEVRAEFALSMLF